MDKKERGEKIASSKCTNKNKYQGGSIPIGYRVNSNGYLEEKSDETSINILQLMKDDDAKQRVISLMDNGQKMGVRKIAELLGTSHMTVWRILKDIKQKKL